MGPAGMRWAVRLRDKRATKVADRSCRRAERFRDGARGFDSGYHNLILQYPNVFRFPISNFDLKLNCNYKIRAIVESI